MASNQCKPLLEDVGEAQQEAKHVFALRDYRLLWGTNVSVFCGKILMKMASLQWLYEATGSSLVMGGLGVIQLMTQVPAILFGGVLADEMERRRLVASMQGIAAIACTSIWVLGVLGFLLPWHIYISVGLLSASGRIEASARNALLPMVVPKELLGRAVSATILTDGLGEMLAPFLFFVATLGESLNPAFGIAAFAYVMAAVLPLMIEADCRPLTLGESNATQSSVSSTSRLTRCKEGLSYIFHHPVLPGLYLLDWGMTVFTFYRELFPAFAATLLRSRPAWLSLRATTSLLTCANYAGAVVGSLFTFSSDSNPYKGRLVLKATLVYGAFCALFGASSIWWLGAFAVFGAGAADAIGMVNRKVIVATTTPTELQGRTSAGQSLAANVANSIGQIYVAAACSIIGAGPTMITGGCLTWVSVFVAARLIPALVSHSVTSS
eukprot:TRINITY_DN8673_c0_g2_i1.p1 TRINITY_DN8673_c0_g2~~TRINITY_DN8673_c0_g2_i1.p1  ORF type:complete len:453 (-),score=43.63 TRINITY_DN8673_c0_g2_i1:36-1349(-)